MSSVCTQRRRFFATRRRHGDGALFAAAIAKSELAQLLGSCAILLRIMRFTQDQLLRWALSGALANRREFISDRNVWSDESLRVETQRLIDTFESLQAKKSKPLRARGEALRLACIYGEIDRQTYIETVCNQPHKAPDMRTEREMEMLAALHKLRQKAWGLTGLERSLLGPGSQDLMAPPKRRAAKTARAK